MPPPFRIVAIAQVHDELRRGNLRRFVEYLRPLVADIVICDSGSTDGSGAYLQAITPHVFRLTRNDFLNERAVRQELLERALSLRPDFVLWLDADEVLTATTSMDLQKAAAWCVERDLDGLLLHELNMWRSGSWRRTDNSYDDGWFVRLWRVSPKLRFSPAKRGLHQRLYPESIKRIERYELLSVLHYGFSSDEQILFKYLNYRRHGQADWLLSRLIDESSLTLERVSPEHFPADLRREDSAPLARPLQWWLAEAERRAPELIGPRVSIIALIYKNTDWLRFSYEQILKYANLDETEIFFVANDAAPHVRTFLRDRYIPHYIFDNTSEHRTQWYINNVYRAWNFGARIAKGEYLLFVNSDMAFTPGWVEKLLSRMDGHNCVASRLVESGKLRSGLYGIERDFGRALASFDERAFQKFAAGVAADEVREGGLFMPFLIRRDDFLRVGGYPEGNVVPGSDPITPVIAERGGPMVSGDAVLMERLRRHGIGHQTDFNTLTYHFQEGEMDDSLDAGRLAPPPVAAIVNDWLLGRMGERTMWNMLVEGLPNVIGIDQSNVGEGQGFEARVRRRLQSRFQRTRIVLQNATFVDTIDPDRWTIAFLQDDLRRMGRPSAQQERVLAAARTRVTNSLLTARSYPEYNFEIIPLGVDQELFRPMDQATARRDMSLPAEKKTAIFVGDLSAVKGWPEVEALVRTRPDLHWIIVSKSAERFDAPNATMFNRVDQRTLARLYNAADVFVLGSPAETQCLAAIEAGMCGKPVVMHDTGIFWGWIPEERAKVGWFGEDLGVGLDFVLSAEHAFASREFLIAQGLTVDAMIERWRRLLQAVSLRLEQADAVARREPISVKLKREARTAVDRAGRQALRAVKLALKRVLPRPVTDALYDFIYRHGRE